MSATWPEALATLETAVGLPGSGRQRYGAAMTLWREGMIAHEALEVYRIASALDAEDPAPMLAQAGLPRPGSEIAALAAAAASLIETFQGPGIAEVRAGLATAQPAVPAPSRNPLVAARLPAALAAMTATESPAPGLAGAIRTAAPWLGWTTYDDYAPDRIGPAFLRGHAFAPLATGASFELGLFLVAPGVFYRDRAHAAPELYLPLTGPHGWRFDPGAPLDWRPALTPVWNPPHQPHATKAGAVPFLCLYAWTADIDAVAYVLPAPDWATLEAVP